MKQRLIFFFLIFLLGSCATKVLPPVHFQTSDHIVNYLKEVKPILDNRCVVCHSCYNSPCQLKLSSYEGLDRGATKKAIYSATRLHTMDPTRLFTDAMNTEEWRKKEFFSVTQNTAKNNTNNSLILQMINHKIENPVSTGDYFPEADDCTCAEDGKQLAGYLEKHPNSGMPFGFPPLKQKEFDTIANWLLQGARGPNTEEQKKITSPPTTDEDSIAKWESFFNDESPKYRMTARYLYEHLFLAHIKFDTKSQAFYEIVRSRTPVGQPLKLVATVRPYDDPETDFVYYRFRRIYSTIVHKTHMVFELNDEVFTRINELFIVPQWMQKPHEIGYAKALVANPFNAFAQIPPRSRYQFLLDHAHYIIMTFIRGPVCKGQIALDVIHDHFWVMFLDPDYDLSVKYPGFLKLHQDNLRMPIENGSDYGIFKVLANRHYNAAKAYYHARQDFYMAHYYDGLGLDAIWKGNNKSDAPVLTVFRHFDSASVHRGVLGDLPHTMWVIDYPLLERIYYALVAGFDVYGNLGHQLAVRLYMDTLRVEGESYFLDFLPSDIRESSMREWYQGAKLKNLQYQASGMGTQIDFAGHKPKREFIEKVINEHLPRELNIGFDPVNYMEKGSSYPDLPEQYNTRQDFLQAFHAASGPGTNFFRLIQDNHVNVGYVRVRIPDGEDEVVSIVINRWHDNVAHPFSEKGTLNPSRDVADFIPGFIGSYPNFFFVVGKDELPDFFDMLVNFDYSKEMVERVKKYGINRANPEFWESYDWFQERFLRQNPVTGGLFDLNRYYHKAINDDSNTIER
jgi:hypothetical protein